MCEQMDITRNPISITPSISSTARNCNGSSLEIPLDPSWPKIPRRQLPFNIANEFIPPSPCCQKKSQTSLPTNCSPILWDNRTSVPTKPINSSASLSFDRCNYAPVRLPQRTFIPPSIERRPAGCLDSRFHKRIKNPTSQDLTNQTTKLSTSNLFQNDRQDAETNCDIKIENTQDNNDGNIRNKNCMLPEGAVEVDLNGNNVGIQVIDQDKTPEKMLLETMNSDNKSKTVKLPNRSISLTDLTIKSNNTFNNIKFNKKTFNHPIDMMSTTDESCLMIPIETQRMLNTSYIEYYNKLNSPQYKINKNNQKVQDLTPVDSSSSEIRQTLDQCTAISSMINSMSTLDETHQDTKANHLNSLFINNKITESDFDRDVSDITFIKRNNVKKIRFTDEVESYIYRDNDDYDIADHNSITTTETSFVPLFNQQRQQYSESKRQIKFITFRTIIGIIILFVVILHLIIALSSQSIIEFISGKKLQNVNNYDNNNYLKLLTNYVVASFHAAFLQVFQLIDKIILQLTLSCTKCNNYNE